MPQLVVNMKVDTQNIVSRKLKSKHFKLRHAPYSNRYHQLEKRRKLELENEIN